MKNFDIAKSRAEEAIRLFPDFAEGHETIGDLMLVQGRAEVARRAYEQAMRLDPTKASVHDKIDRSSKLEKQLATSRPTKATPDAPHRRMAFEAEISRALKFEKDGDKRKAESIYRDILTKDPDHVEAARLLAAIAVENDRYRDAQVFLKRALSIAPDYARAWVDLANVQRMRNMYEDCLESARQVLRLNPEMAESHILYASAIGMMGDHEEAIAAYQRAFAISPEKAGVMCSMGHQQKTVGRQDEAIVSYRKAIELKPDHAESYWSLANLKTFRFEDHEVSAMEALVAGDELPAESRTQIHNALGFEYEAREDYDNAFINFKKCNDIRRKSERYDAVDTENTYQRIAEMYTQDYLAEKRGQHKSETTPIFIVGLPRSGSTLIEQILASHSQVDGTHELVELPKSIEEFRRRSKNERFPDAFGRLSSQDYAALGDEYIKRTRLHRGDAPYFVDKNPNNFIYAGVIALAIPNARIINALRQPLDSCLGSFKQLFASGQPFSYDLTEVGEYYLQYRKLMEHWHDVLPGLVLDVQYEEVVADLDTQVRRILDFCGLPFEDACLHFHESDRAVKTASSEQVRLPIYSSSVNLWRNYEPHLETLVHILEPVLRDRPENELPTALAQSSQT